MDTGHGTQTFEIVATRAGRRLEITTARTVVEVTEVTRGGTPVRTGRFMASRVVALVEHPALEGDGARVEVETHRRMSTGESVSRRGREPVTSSSRRPPTDQLSLVAAEPSTSELVRDLEADVVDELTET